MKTFWTFIRQHPVRFDSIGNVEIAWNHALELAATLVQNYDTCGDNTQAWQDKFAKEIRKLKS